MWDVELIHALRVSFEIALHQGCRLAETLLDVHAVVDLEARVIRFHAKGDRYYETSLNPKLIPLFQELRKSGRRMTYNYNVRTLTARWSQLFKQAGLEHLSFHSTRVTCISRLERAGAPEAAVMKLVNHASKTIHRIYNASHQRGTRSVLDLG